MLLDLLAPAYFEKYSWIWATNHSLPESDNKANFAREAGQVKAPVAIAQFSFNNFLGIVHRGNDADTCVSMACRWKLTRKLSPKKQQMDLIRPQRRLPCFSCDNWNFVPTSVVQQ